MKAGRKLFKRESGPSATSALADKHAQQVESPEPARDEVERLAYQYWEQGGYRPDSAEDDWYQAENDLRERARAAFHAA